MCPYREGYLDIPKLRSHFREILGTAFSVGCQVDGQSPKTISDGIESGEIQGKSNALRIRLGN